MKDNKSKYISFMIIIFFYIYFFSSCYLIFAKELKVMTFNTWYGFINVDDGFNKGVKVIRESGAEIIGLQESASVAEEIGKSLGWNVVHEIGQGVCIISKYPILEKNFNNAWAVGALIRVIDNPIVDIYVWNCHLSSSPYGPNYARDGYPVEDILNKEKVRIFEINSIVEDIKDLLNNTDTIPIILMGDFNTPSHLDWIEKTKNSHYGYVIKWPVSVILEELGMKDSFRIVYPDPSINPGNTWSPIYKINEPQDRIDRIYFKGNKLKVIDSRVYTGHGKINLDPDYWDNDWPSDHAALITIFDIGGCE